MIRNFKIQVVTLVISLLPIKIFAQQCEQLIWSDEFDGTSLNSGNWSYETGNGQDGWGTGQLDYATNRNENVRVEDGKLILELRKENYSGYEYTSGRLVSYQKQSFKYGRIEARIKGVDTQGLGFAFWMLGEDYETVWWPKCGEIDIMENTGGDPGFNIGTAHFQESWGHHYDQGSYTLTEGKFADDFHVFAIEWTPKHIKWFIDDVNYHTFDITDPINNYRLFDRPFFIILSTGVGGSYSGNPDATTVFPMTAEIDYVRVYQGAFSASIEGETSVMEQTYGVTYRIDVPEANAYQWTVPSDAEIVSGQGSSTISVNWGSTSGDISVSTNGDCGDNTYSLAVEVKNATSSDNLALNKTTYTSSNENASYSGNYCVDGDVSTRWASDWSEPQWVYVDLEKVYDIDQVILKWQYARATAYEVQTSYDATNWTTIYTETNGSGDTDDIQLAGNGRYVRILCNQRNTEWGFSLYELEVYGTSATETETTYTNAIRLYPNPASSYIWLDDSNHQITQLELFNSIGECLLKETISHFP